MKRCTGGTGRASIAGLDAGSEADPEAGPVVGAVAAAGTEAAAGCELGELASSNRAAHSIGCVENMSRTRDTWFYTLCSLESR
ncbi:MAG: hypothetical protein JXR83_10600 [Deltaproteobacteria bacterium]|nr:hypothetical protein [Deltaproteobacteria bacterium]